MSENIKISQQSVPTLYTTALKIFVQNMDLTVKKLNSMQHLHLLPTPLLSDIYCEVNILHRWHKKSTKLNDPISNFFFLRSFYVRHKEIFIGISTPWDVCERCAPHWTWDEREKEKKSICKLSFFIQKPWFLVVATYIRSAHATYEEKKSQNKSERNE